MNKRSASSENIYSSACIQALEQEYCSSCSAAVVSSRGLGARVMSRIYNGGRQALYTATVGAMLVNNAAPVAWGATTTVSAGVTSTGLVANNGDLINVYGSTTSTTVNSKGSQFIYSGGQDMNATINNGGRQYISDGGVGNNAVVNSYGSQMISSGGVANSTTVNSGGNQLIYSSGIANDTIINGSRGWQTISFGGVANNTIVNSEGIQEMYNGGVANGTVINSNGSQRIFGGVASNTIVSSQGHQDVIGGTAENGTIHSGGYQYISNGAVANNTTMSGGHQYISSGGVANGTVINSGAQTILGGGVANDTIVNSYGTQTIHAVTVSGTTISGTANNTIIHWGYQSVYSGGVANSTIVDGGWQFINNSGVANDTIVNSWGNQRIYGGVANGTIVNDAGQYIYNGGIANSTTVNTYGLQEIYSDGVANDTTVNGAQWISSGGIANNTTVNLWGAQIVHFGGIASSTIVSSGGRQGFWLGGRAIDTVQEIGGNVNVTVQGGDTLTSVTGTNESGTFSLQNGVANNFILYTNGYQTISSGGIANNTIMSGGMIELYENGTLNNLTATGGELRVYDDNVTLQGDISLTNTNVYVAPFDPWWGSPTTLEIENLTAHNAIFAMNVDLENQTADQLKIISSCSGDAVLALTNVASTAQETTGDGIKLVDFDSAATVNGTFDLVGGRWDEGGYAYKLFQNEGDPDYYLRSAGLSDTFKTMLNMPIMNVVAAQTGMNSLQKRLGDLRGMNNLGAQQGVWVRSYYKDMTVKDLIKTDMSLFGAEAGYDWLFRAEEPTKLYAGVLVGFVSANSIKTQSHSGNYNKGEGESPSVGVYATLLNEDGWFVDIAARNFWTKLDMKNYASDGTELAYKPKRNVIAASVEVGKDYQKDISRNEYIRIEPKVEVGYMNAASGNASVTNGTSDLHYDSANYVNAKAGVLLAYNKIRDNGLLIAPLLELAYRQEFAGTDKISYGGAEEKSKLSGGTFEVNAGLNMELAKDLYWYGMGSYEASDKVKGWGLHAGIRYAFGGDKTVTKAKEVKEATPKKQGSTQKPTITKFVPEESIKKEEVKQIKKSSQTKKDYSFMNETEDQWREGKQNL